MSAREAAKDFMAGFIVAGGDSSTARDLAAQFIACCWGSDCDSAFADPAMIKVVEVLQECIPRDAESQPWIALMKDPECRGAYYWLVAEDFVRESGKGQLVLTEKFYAREKEQSHEK